MRNTLQRIQRAYPELERQIDVWNETLRRAGKTWKVRQIGDLEVYPDQKHGFRFVGTRGKVVLADKEIGTVQWGNFARGQHKGQAKFGFDLIAWWKSIQSGERMPREEVQRIIESRLPTEQPALVVPAEDLRDHSELSSEPLARQPPGQSSRLQGHRALASPPKATAPNKTKTPGKAPAWSASGFGIERDQRPLAVA